MSTVAVRYRSGWTGEEFDLADEFADRAAAEVYAAALTVAAPGASRAYVVDADDVRSTRPALQAEGAIA